MEHPAGHHVRAHMHPAMERDIPTTSEFFFIQKGRARVTIYDNEWNEVALQELVDGDSMLILGGGHEVEMLEETRMFEIKQGPYPGDEKAKIFRPDL